MQGGLCTWVCEIIHGAVKYSVSYIYSIYISLLLIRESIERLCQEAQSLSEAGRGSGGEVRVTGQLQMEHQALLKTAREKLRCCQESQAFGETLQGVWAWLEEIQERLGTVDSTMGTKEQLEQRLETVQVRGWFGL